MNFLQIIFRFAIIYILLNMFLGTPWFKSVIYRVFIKRYLTVGDMLSFSYITAKFLDKVCTRTVWTQSLPPDVKLETWRTSTPTWQSLAAGSTSPPPADSSRTRTCRWWAELGLLVGRLFCMTIMHRSTEEIEWRTQEFLDYIDTRKLILIMLI